MSEPEERELLPGVFITDFRTAASAAQASAANSDPSHSAASVQHPQSIEQEAKRKHEDEMGGFGSSSSSSSAAASSSSSRAPNSMLPPDIPSDVEALELELVALETNLAQLIKSNQVLEQELITDPGEQIYIDAIRENRETILRRSDKIIAIKRQIQILAPHRAQTSSVATEAGAAAVDAAIPPPAANNAAQQNQSTGEPDGGLFL